MTQLAGRVVLFGGSPSGDGPCSNQVYTLDTSTLQSACVWRKAAVTGVPPVGRSGHTLTAVGGDKLVLFGGMDSSSKLLNDTHILQLGSTCSWTRVEIHGRPPIARYGHSATLLPALPGKRPPSLLVFGGAAVLNKKMHFPNTLHQLDLTECVWSTVTVGYMFPAPRYGHSAVMVPPPPDSAPSSPSQVMVFGGMNTMYCASDIWRLRVRRRRTRFYEPDAPDPSTGVVDSGSDGEEWLDTSAPILAGGGSSRARASAAAGAGAGATAGFGAGVGAGFKKAGASLFGLAAGAATQHGGSADGNPGGGLKRTEHDREECQVLLHDMQQQLMKLRKDHSVVLARLAEEQSARIAAETSRDDAVKQVKGLQEELTTTQTRLADVQSRMQAEVRVVALVSLLWCDCGAVTYFPWRPAPPV